MSDYNFSSISTKMVMVALGIGADAVWVNVASIEALVPAGLQGAKIHLASGVTLHLEDMTPGAIVKEIVKQIKRTV